MYFITQFYLREDDESIAMHPYSQHKEFKDARICLKELRTSKLANEFIIIPQISKKGLDVFLEILKEDKNKNKSVLTIIKR